MISYGQQWIDLFYVTLIHYKVLWFLMPGGSICPWSFDGCFFSPYLLYTVYIQKYCPSSEISTGMNLKYWTREWKGMWPESGEQKERDTQA